MRRRWTADVTWKEPDPHGGDGEVTIARTYVGLSRRRALEIGRTLRPGGKPREIGRAKVEPPVIGKGLAVIVDMDGTLALRGDGPDVRGYFDWHRVGEDLPNPAVVELAHMVAASGRYNLIVMTGRDEVCRRETAEWLVRHGINYSMLLMRPRDNFEKDTVIKERLYREQVEPYFTVVFVVEDRQPVVGMWRSLGLTCLQVADGD